MRCKRDTALQEFIDRNELNAGCTFRVADGRGIHNDSQLTAYFKGTKQIYVLEFGVGLGWDILLPACDANNTEQTLLAAQRYLDSEDSHV